MPQLFDPTKYTPEQAASLVNIPGQSLADTNTPGQIARAQANPGVITPETLNVETPLKIQDTGTTPIEPALGPTLITPTAEENQVSSQLNKMQQIQQSLVGKGAYQAEKEQELVLPAKQALDENTALLISLQKESAAIPSILQRSYERGVTAGVIDAKQRAMQNDLNIRINSVSALTAGLQNNLSNAQYYADKAVQAKYGTQEEQLAADRANLELLLQDPKLSIADKNRALKVQAEQDARANKLAEDKQNAKDVQGVAIDAASNSANFIATSAYKTVSQALTAIQDAKTPLEATIIATNAGLLKTPEGNDTQVVRLDNGSTILLDTVTGEVIKYLGGAAPVVPSGVVGGVVDSTGLLGANGKPLTTAQLTSRGFYDRVVESDKIITELGGQFTGPISYISKYMPNIIKSSDRQRFEQAQRDFVNAVLRPESGAAISPSEFDSAAKQYFPQPGDSAAVVAQKAANRKTKINSLALQAGIGSTVSNTTDLRAKYNY